MGDAQQLKRQLKIKTGSCRRLFKDYTAYEAEAREQEARIERMAAQPDVDEYAVKKQREVLAETQMMITDSKKRLSQARADLQELLASLGTLGDSETELAEAREVLEATASPFSH